jgi:hypothetical protein
VASRLEDRSLRHDPLALLVATVAVLWMVLAIGSPLTGRTTFHATQLLDSFAPWQAATPNGAVPSNTCTSDTVDGVLPGRVAAATALGHGNPATYDADDSGGSSDAATEESGLYNPATFLPYVLLPHHVAPAYEKLLELIAAVLGMVLWARSLGLSRAAGIVGGVVYGTSGFMVSWTNWPQTSVAAFIPMVFWATERLVQRRNLASGLLATVPVTAMVLGGFPAVTGWTLYAVGAYVAVRLAADRADLRGWARGVGWGAVGLGLTAGISAFVLLPFVRAYSATDFGYRNYETARLPHLSFLTALFPQALGGCSPNRGPAYFGGAVPVEGEMFLGSVALVLALVALTGRLRPGIPRGVRTFLVVLALFVLNQIFLHNALSDTVEHLPVFQGSLSNRMRPLVAVAIAGLAAMGIDRIQSATWRPFWWRRPQTLGPAAVWLAATAVVAYLGWKARAVAIDHHVAGQVDGATVRALVLAAAAAVLVLVAARWTRVRGLVVVAIAVLVAVQGVAYAQWFFPREPNRAFYPVTPTHAFLQAHVGDNRMVGDQMAMFPGTNRYYGIRSATGHVFTQPGWSDLLRAADPKVFLTPTYTAFHASATSVASPVLDLLGVTYLVNDPSTPAYGQQHAAPPADGTVRVAPRAGVTEPTGATQLRAVGVTFAAPLTVDGAPYAALRVDVLGPGGKVIASGTRRILGDLPAGAGLSVPVTDTGSATSLRLRITLQDGTHAATLAAHGGVPALSTITGADDGLSIVLANGATVYKRSTALPRIRWAGTVRTVPVAQQTSVLSTTPATAGSVVLAPGTPGHGAGQPATVHVLADKATEVSATVDAQGSGYLVVADAEVPGWHATVDGRSVPLVTADHALHAVPVPVGQHTVTLTFRTPGSSAGIVITLVSLVVYATGWVAVVLSRRRRRRRARTAPAGG